jgi:hypothetical protein
VDSPGAYSFNSGALVLPATANVTGNLNKFNTSVVRVGLTTSSIGGRTKRDAVQPKLAKQAPGSSPGLLLS